MPVSKHPKYVITCNFKSFLVYDMENPTESPDCVPENIDREAVARYIGEKEEIHGSPYYNSVMSSWTNKSVMNVAEQVFA